MKLLLVYLFLVLLSLCMTWSQSCDKWEGFPEGCSSLMKKGMSVYINKTTQTSISNSISSIIESALTLPSRCSTGIIEIICSEAFPPCIINTKNTKNVFGRPVCKSICESIPNDCKKELLGVNLSIPDCYTASLGQMRFPSKDSPRVVVDEDGSLFEIPCVAPIFSVPNASCPKHFSKIDDFNLKEDDPKDACERTCPYETWSMGEYLGLYIPTAILGGLGILLSFCFIFPSLLDKKRFKFPHIIPNVLLWLATSTSFFLLWPIFFGYENVMCSNDTTFSTQSNSKCSIYGISIYWLSLTTLAWWLVLLNMQIVAKLPQLIPITKKKRTIMHWCSHVLAWGIPSVCTVYVATNNRFVGIPESGFPCFVDPDEDNGLWLAGTFFIPVGVIVLCGVGMLLIHPIVLIVRIILKITSKEVTQDTILHSSKKWAMQEWRIHVFVIYYAIVWVQIVIYYITVRSLYDTIEDGRDDWYECLESNSESPDDCDLDNQLLYVVPAYIHYVAVTSPIVIILLFGFTYSNLRFYYNFLWGLIRFRIVVLSGSSNGIKKKRIEVFTRRRLLETHKREKGEREKYKENDLSKVEKLKTQSKRYKKQAVRRVKQELLYGFGAKVREPKDFVNNDYIEQEHEEGKESFDKSDLDQREYEEDIEMEIIERNSNNSSNVDES